MVKLSVLLLWRLNIRFHYHVYMHCLERPSPKWLILCWVGRLTVLTHCWCVIEVLFTDRVLAYSVYFRSVIDDVQNRLKAAAAVGGGSSGAVDDDKQHQRFLDTKNFLAAIHADVKGLLSKSKVVPLLDLCTITDCHLMCLDAAMVIALFSEIRIFDSFSVYGTNVFRLFNWVIFRLIDHQGYLTDSVDNCG